MNRESRVERTGVSRSVTETKVLSVITRNTVRKRFVHKEESHAQACASFVWRPSIIRSAERAKVLHRFRSRSGDSVRPLSGQRFNL